MTLLPIDGQFQDWEALLALILSAFAFMHGRIDPPSSALRLTPDALKAKAATETAFAALEDGLLVGCIFCKQEPPDCLYIGKLAVAPAFQRRGIGRSLLRAAEETAAARGLQCLRLETRIELAENHRVFERLGFVRTAERSHPGFSRVTFVDMRKRL